MIRADARSAANDLDAALRGRPRNADMAGLAALAAELEGLGRSLVSPAMSPSRREALRLTVVAAGEQRRPHGARARFRGAALTVAAVAGAGLVVAGAASRSNPALLVMDAARELPKLASRQAPPPEFAIEGEVVATRNEGRTLEVRTGGVTIVVEAPREPRAITVEGTPLASANIGQGDNVRVTTRDSGDGPVTAKRIEVLPPAAAAAPKPAPATGADSGAAGPTPVAGGASSGSNLPPGLTETATPTPTKPATPVTAIAAGPTLAPTRTATPEPTATPTKRPKPSLTTTTAATPAPVENSTSNLDSSDLQAKK